MKYPYLLLTMISVVFIIACGTLPLAQTALEYAPDATQTPQERFIAHETTVTPTPHVLTVLGSDAMWNIRTGAGLGNAVTGYAYSGDTFTFIQVWRGWVQTESGWICGRAFGASEECE